MGNFSYTLKSAGVSGKRGERGGRREKETTTYHVGCALLVWAINPAGYVGFQIALPQKNGNTYLQFQVFGPKASWQQFNLNFDSSLV